MSDRETFEAWVSSPPFEREILRHSDDPVVSSWPGQYVEYEVQFAWDAWQAGVEAREKEYDQNSRG